MKHLISLDDIDAGGIATLLSTADYMAEILDRPQPKVPALRTRTVCSLFFEDSTRTRLSFETAAKRLFAYSILYLFLIFALIIAEHLGGIAPFGKIIG